MKKIDDHAIEEFRKLIDRELERRGKMSSAPADDYRSRRILRARDILNEIDDLERQLIDMRSRGRDPSWDLIEQLIREIRTRIIEISQGT